MNKEFTILIVEDQKENIDVLVGTLENRYELMVATNGERAVNMLKNSHVDLILLDILLPKKNGYEVCATIKESKAHKDLPIIFFIWPRWFGR